METYCCDLVKLTEFLVGLGLPVISCTTGHAGIMINTDRDLTPDEQALMSRVMVLPVGVCLLPESIEVVSLI